MTGWTRTHIAVFLAIAAAAWGAALWLQGAALTREFFGPFGSVVTVLAITSAVFEKIAWRWAWLHGWFVERPDLRGTFRVEIRSNWIDPATRQGVPPIQAYMGVTQSLSRLQMHLMTRESESWLIADRIAKSEKNHGYRIAAVYTNQPQLWLRGVRSDIHGGAFLLETHGQTPRRPDAVAGEYWTDRGTGGTMVLTAREKTVYSRFEDAEAAMAPR